MPKSWFHRVVAWRQHYEGLLPDADRIIVAKTPILFSKEDLGTVAGRHTVGTASHLIILSPYMTEVEAMETVGHEYAHLCNWILNKKGGHGKEWKNIMCQLGLPPRECHNIPLETRKTLSKIFENIDKRRLDKRRLKDR